MHRKVTTIAAAALAAATLAAAPPALARPRLTPEQQLSKLLAGRVAGQPQDCISLYPTQHTQVIDKTAVVYESGGTLYVNRPDNPQDLGRDDILVTDLRGTTQLCSIDVVNLRDRTSFFYDGFVSLGKFVPYRRVTTN